MLEVINRYCHGYVAVPVIVACRAHGLFELLEQQGVLGFAALVERLHANDGHFRVALNVLESLGWLERDAGDAYRLTHQGALHARVPDDVLALLALPFDDYLRGGVPGDDCSLSAWFERSLRGWDAHDALLADLLDGLLVPSLLLALRAPDGRDAQLGPAVLASLPEPARGEVSDYFTRRGWLEADGDAEAPALSAAGSMLWARMFNAATVLSYRPMFGRIGELIFGTDGSVRAATGDGDESHVDRTLNVQGSGFGHQKYFGDLEAILVSIFDTEDFDAQPAYVVDMGCGDGTLLKHIYTVITTRTRRGWALDTHPLQLIGVDFNRKSLEETTRTLADIPHLTLWGDIGDPRQLLADLEAAGVDDPDRILHVRTFLDHERPFREPRGEAMAVAVSGTTVHVAADGRALPEAAVNLGLAEHLHRWAGILGAHGLIVLEVHSLPPAVVRDNLDSESLHYDAFHAFSGQLLVEATTFLDAAAAAGLFQQASSWRKYPRSLPFARITLSRLEKRDYRIRQVSEADLPALLRLEAACWPDGGGFDSSAIFRLDASRRDAALPCAPK
ncbi:hypothetical protein [Burkholderia gladioli]|uniref:Polyketide synthase n=1 Tax=Burkholderia gladioli (strain BSR3) TaxID=999541 RepID=F2LT80_BURGS|nr:hypothetical protein [Burkholderia gladioli]AEA66026.1 polyketide synthase [Burkholderia gladioli BSR3]MBW5285059.1 polyketide synthase [Burkholderia gladioli]